MLLELIVVSQLVSHSSVIMIYLPVRPGVQRLAVSSFVIMRFFAAAILNPKAFEIRKDQPDLRVSRTLLLLSKLLQRLSNCSVSEGPLSSKVVHGYCETVKYGINSGNLAEWSV